MSNRQPISEPPQGAPVRIAVAKQRALCDAGANAALDWALECFAGYQFRQGHEALALAIAREPDFLALKWLQFQYPFDPSPQSDNDIAEFIARWRGGLRWFESQDFSKPEIAREIWGCIRSATPFYLHYVADAVPEMRRYGRLVARMMAALDRGDTARAIRNGRRRIAVVSAHLRDHTVSRLFLPLFERLDKARFDLHYLSMEDLPRERQDRLRRSGYLHLGPREGRQWRQTLAEIGADIIVFPEIGMHPLHQGLAALRLAPVQVVMWGHPVTSGLPTIDYAIVPDALEPPNAEDHYHESLIRLPGLGHGLARPPERPDGTLHAPGVRRAQSDTVEILCAQSAFKLLPAQDELFASVLRAVPNSRLHLTPLVPEPCVESLRDRMRPIFSRTGIDVDERVVMHPHMPLSEFVEFISQFDFAIDTIGWSGGMSALDQFAAGLPVVALEGPTMRSRQTASLLRWLDLDGLVAKDLADMIAVATKLGTDRNYRDHIRTVLFERSSRLYAQDATQDAFEVFLSSVQPPC